MVIAIVLSKITAILIFSCLLIFAAYPVLAKDATISSTTRREKATQRVEAIKDKMATREATLKAKLDKFKDKKKAQATERINANLNQINQKQTQEMLKHLDKMSEILTKVETRGGSASSIEDAKTSIASASSSVKTQAGKDYTITVTSESTIKTDAQKVRDQLHSDLQAVRKQIISAKQAVANAVRTVRSKGESNGQ